jgi:omega-6 fatty acid desaturase (delta-12 desaturase)
MVSTGYSVSARSHRGDASNLTGFLFTARAAAATSTGVLLSASGSSALWLAGQGVLALGLLEWFVLLHECGHGTLFRARWPHAVVGQVAGMFALIPFRSWQAVHAEHHRWTGWQDLDPTTASLAPRKRSRLELRVADACWRFWIPVFSILYRWGNYWNLRRLKRLFGERRVFRGVALNVVVLLAVYGVAAYWFGYDRLVRLAGLAIVINLVVEDPLILSQHTHMPRKLSGGQAVRPIPASAQVSFTRSLGFPDWFSYWVLMGFDAHELHHRYPQVSGYRLRRLGFRTPNEIHWWSWIRSAKRVPGSVFLFESPELTRLRI